MKQNRVCDVTKGRFIVKRHLRRNHLLLYYLFFVYWRIYLLGRNSSSRKANREWQNVCIFLHKITFANFILQTLVQVKHLRESNPKNALKERKLLASSRDRTRVDSVYTVTNSSHSDMAISSNKMRMKSCRFPALLQKFYFYTVSAGWIALKNFYLLYVLVLSE